MSRRPESGYQIGWICALRSEVVAARAMLDEDHGLIKGRGQDHNTYFAGHIHDHDVVIAGLPAGVDGLVAAANVAKDMIRTFSQLKFMLLVGIGGGIPNLQKDIDIRLGDVVVSSPSGINGGVVQYNKGKALQGGGFQLKGAQNAPPHALLTAITLLQADHDLNGSQAIPSYLSSLVKRLIQREEQTGADLKSDRSVYPGTQHDQLFDALYPHPKTEKDCTRCLSAKVLSRHTRRSTDPQVHYGTIASGDEVVKDSGVRDALRDDHGALCVEMEAAGLMNQFPSIVIRGICDYADSHKNDVWHQYAANTAAAYTKELLHYISTETVQQEKTVHEVLELVERKFQPLTENLLTQEARHEAEQARNCLRAFKLGSYEEQKNVNPKRASGTCRWVLENTTYGNWRRSPKNDLLWITADPGCGKSVLSRLLIDDELPKHEKQTCCYFFFRDNVGQDNIASAFCALLHQLFKSQPQLLGHAMSAWNTNGERLTQEVDELWRIFLMATSDQASSEVFCVLDALDECKVYDRHRLIDKLSQFYASRDVSSNEKHSLKILVTSRPYDDIQIRFQRGMRTPATSVQEIRLRGEDANSQIRTEINAVIRARVSEMEQDIPLSKSASARLELQLLSMQNRTYLWLSLAMDGIDRRLRQGIRQPDKESVEAAITSLPQSVEDAYEKILEKVLPDQRDVVRTILQILVSARRPLAIGEMSIALSVALSDSVDSLNMVTSDKAYHRKYIRKWCGLFVFIDGEKIYLAHQTAKEFLIRRSEAAIGIWRHSLDIATTELLMTKVCVRLLNLPSGLGEDPFSELLNQDQREDAESFLHYAATYWPNHFRESQLESCPFQEMIFHLYDHPESFAWWFAAAVVEVPEHWRFLKPSIDPRQEYRYIARQSRGTIRTGSRLHLASLFGHYAMLSQILHDPFTDVNSVDLKNHTALSWALEKGFEKEASLLIQFHANPDITGKVFAPPLLQAAMYCGWEMTQLLLNHGADQVAIAEKIYAVVMQANSEMNEQLFNSGILNQQAKSVCLALAAQKGQVTFVKRLMSAGAVVPAVSGSGTKPLERAVSQHLKAAAQIWSTVGVDASARNLSATENHISGTLARSNSSEGDERVRIIGEPASSRGWSPKSESDSNTISQPPVARTIHSVDAQDIARMAPVLPRPLQSDPPSDPEPPSSPEVAEDHGMNSIFSDTIDVKLNLMFHGIKIPEFVDVRIAAFQWTKAGEYKRLMQVAFIKKHLEVHKDMKTHHLYLRYGICQVRGPGGLDHDNLASVINNQEELAETAIRGIFAFVSNHPYQNHELHVYLDYASAQIEPATAQQIREHVYNRSYVKLIKTEIEKKVVTNFIGQDYIPRRDLDVFLKPSVINRVIAEDESLQDLQLDKEQQRDFVIRIQSLAPKLFAICVFHNLDMAFLKHLMEEPHNCTDFQWHRPQVFMYCHLSDCQHNIGQLVNRLPMFFAEEITRDRQYHSLSRSQILPLHDVLLDEETQKPKRESIGEGRSGRVFAVKFNLAHTLWSDAGSARGNGIPHRTLAPPNVCESPDQQLVIKQFTEQTAFECERVALKYFADYPHPHVVVRLTSWTQDRSNYILYDRARCNLRTYTTTVEAPKLSRPQVQWFLGQLEGLASAIGHIHYLKRPAYSNPEPEDDGKWGLHNDIRLENILVFGKLPNENIVFKITDFNLGVFNDAQSNWSGTSPYVGGSETYLAPEVRKVGASSRPFDMWAIGCVYLEMMLWLFGKGQEDTNNGIPGFSDLRLDYPGCDPLVKEDRYWACKNHGKDWSDYFLKPAVTQVIEELRTEHCVDMRAFLDLLNIIESLLCIDPQNRMTADKLIVRMNKL